MALVLSDRVKETTTSTGTSDFTLGGAVTGFQTFSAGVGNSNTTYYAVSLGADWEVGLGTLSSDGLTLARTTVYQSSNSDTKVSFGSGSKEVFVTYAADKAVFEDASGNVTLPANLTVTGGATTDSVQLDLTAGITPAVGQIAWDAAQGTATLGLLGGNVLSRLGQTLVAYVTNAESTTITKGQAVYLFSAQGDRATVKLANNTGDATSAKTLGIVAEDIGANQTGFVVCQGVCYGLDLSAFTAGDTIYLGASAGTLTATKPYAPNHLVYLGVVEKANAGAGQLYVRVQNGYELDEIHNVSAQSPSNGQTIVYNSSTSLWEKNTVSLTAGVNGTLPVANGGTGITSFGSGVATFLGTPSSANLASAVTDETGTGALVFANSPTLVTPALGTPSALVGTNITGTAANFNINGTVGATTPTTGAFTTLSASGAFSANGGATLGDASGDALTINSSAVSIPNGLNFDSNTFFIDATNNRVLAGASAFSLTTTAITPLFVQGQALAGSSNQTLNSNKDFRIFGGSYANNVSTIISFAGQSGINAISYGGNTGAGEPATSHAWFTGTSGTLGAGSESMRLTSTGLGIGTSTIGSDFKTVVYGGFLGIQNATTGTGNNNGLYIGNTGTLAQIYQAENDALTFSTNATERARLSSGGAMMVGTTTGTERLTLANGSGVGAAIAFWANGGGAGNELYIGQGGSNEAYIWNRANQFLAFGTNGTERARIDASGNFNFKNGIIETVYALGTSGSLALNPTNGTIQTCALAGNPTFTDSLSEGHSMVLMLTNATSYTVTWPTTTWVTSAGNVAPTLTAKSTLVFWKVGSTLYGAFVGSYV